MDKDFLLDTDTAKHLFHDYAAKMPIIDYHCHISPQEIAEDHHFRSITEVWLGGDITNGASFVPTERRKKKSPGETSTDLEKFVEYAKALSRSIGNPLYHWSHLELQRYFGINEPLTEKNAEDIFNRCNAKLQEKGMGVQGLIEQSNVKVICTTDDPADDLKWHKKLRDEKTCSAKVYPAMRPDKLMNVDKAGYADYMLVSAKLPASTSRTSPTFAKPWTTASPSLKKWAAALQTMHWNMFSAAKPMKRLSMLSLPKP